MSTHYLQHTQVSTNSGLHLLSNSKVTCASPRSKKLSVLKVSQKASRKSLLNSSCLSSNLLSRPIQQQRAPPRLKQIFTLDSIGNMQVDQEILSQYKTQFLDKQTLRRNKPEDAKTVQFQA